jgi:hypothetical protein
VQNFVQIKRQFSISRWCRKIINNLIIFLLIKSSSWCLIGFAKLDRNFLSHSFLLSSFWTYFYFLTVRTSTQHYQAFNLILSVCLNFVRLKRSLYEKGSEKTDWDRFEGFACFAKSFWVAIWPHPHEWPVNGEKNSQWKSDIDRDDETMKRQLNFYFYEPNDCTALLMMMIFVQIFAFHLDIQIEYSIFHNIAMHGHSTQH